MVLSTGIEDIDRGIRVVLSTAPGERVMRPAFGCGLRRYLMKPNTTATRALIAQDVGRALATWEPRVTVQQVTVTPGDDDPALVLIHVAYTHVRDARPGNLVYPFYLE